ncbi:hypothetical protein EV421DRAFT_1740180 [Armillaria borealis]|uniref:Uncharacterized protein n=1 Tax=Armillaria borealis TaxID=47425 RepID=A0AA39MIG4_9AGAR|nr:hypothetical protein EV421DRAFT_1740180 [Armillaria borealis]
MVRAVDPAIWDLTPKWRGLLGWPLFDVVLGDVEFCGLRAVWDKMGFWFDNSRLRTPNSLSSASRINVDLHRGAIARAIAFQAHTGETEGLDRRHSTLSHLGRRGKSLYRREQTKRDTLGLFKKEVQSECDEVYGGDICTLVSPRNLSSAVATQLDLLPSNFTGDQPHQIELHCMGTRRHEHENTPRYDKLAEIVACMTSLLTRKKVDTNGCHTDSHNRPRIKVAPGTCANSWRGSTRTPLTTKTHARDLDDLSAGAQKGRRHRATASSIQAPANVSAAESAENHIRRYVIKLPIGIDDSNDEPFIPSTRAPNVRSVLLDPRSSHSVHVRVLRAGTVVDQGKSGRVMGIRSATIRESIGCRCGRNDEQRRTLLPAMSTATVVEGKKRELSKGSKKGDKALQALFTGHDLFSDAIEASTNLWITKDDAERYPPDVLIAVLFCRDTGPYFQMSWGYTPDERSLSLFSKEDDREISRNRITSKLLGPKDVSEGYPSRRSLILSRRKFCEGLLVQ